MMLALRPDLCDQEALNTVVCPPNEEGMMDVRGVYRWQAFADYTPTGAPPPELLHSPGDPVEAGSQHKVAPRAASGRSRAPGPNPRGSPMGSYSYRPGAS